MNILFSCYFLFHLFTCYDYYLNLTFHFIPFKESISFDYWLLSTIMNNNCVYKVELSFEYMQTSLETIELIIMVVFNIIALYGKCEMYW